MGTLGEPVESNEELAARVATALDGHDDQVLKSVMDEGFKGIDALANKYADQGVVAYALNDGDPPDLIQAFVEQTGITIPVIDGQGKVIGVVVGMQATDYFGGASSAMGFIIPIAEAAELWPRKE